MRPPRRVPFSLSLITHRRFSVGGRFQRGGKLGDGNTSSSFKRILICENSLERRTRPHTMTLYSDLLVPRSERERAAGPSPARAMSTASQRQDREWPPRVSTDSSLVMAGLHREAARFPDRSVFRWICDGKVFLNLQGRHMNLRVHERFGGLQRMNWWELDLDPA